MSSPIEGNPSTSQHLFQSGNCFANNTTPSTSITTVKPKQIFAKKIQICSINDEIIKRQIKLKRKWQWENIEKIKIIEDVNKTFIEILQVFIEKKIVSPKSLETLYRYFSSCFRGHIKMFPEFFKKLKLYYEHNIIIERRYGLDIISMFIYNLGTISNLKVKNIKYFISLDDSKIEHLLLDKYICNEMRKSLDCSCNQKLILLEYNKFDIDEDFKKKFYSARCIISYDLSSLPKQLKDIVISFINKIEAQLCKKNIFIINKYCIPRFIKLILQGSQKIVKELPQNTYSIEYFTKITDLIIHFFNNIPIKNKIFSIDDILMPLFKGEKPSLEAIYSHFEKLVLVESIRSEKATSSINAADASTYNAQSELVSNYSFTDLSYLSSTDNPSLFKNCEEDEYFEEGLPILQKSLENEKASEEITDNINATIVEDNNEKNLAEGLLPLPEDINDRFQELSNTEFTDINDLLNTCNPSLFKNCEEDEYFEEGLPILQKSLENEKASEEITDNINATIVEDNNRKNLDYEICYPFNSMNQKQNFCTIGSYTKRKEIPADDNEYNRENKKLKYIHLADENA